MFFVDLQKAFDMVGSKVVCVFCWPTESYCQGRK